MTVGQRNTFCHKEALLVVYSHCNHFAVFFANVRLLNHTTLEQQWHKVLNQRILAKKIAYRKVQNCLQNIVKKDPDRGRQSSEETAKRNFIKPGAQNLVVISRSEQQVRSLEVRLFSTMRLFFSHNT